MIGLDTNILVRFLTQDDPQQCKIVNQTLKNFEEKQQGLWVSLIVICELVWVLESCYNQTKAEIYSTLMELMQIQQLKIDSTEILYDALKDYLKNSKVDFSDCLIAHYNKASQCMYTLTFDKIASKLEDFKLLT